MYLSRHGGRGYLAVHDGRGGPFGLFYVRGRKIVLRAASARVATTATGATAKHSDPMQGYKPIANIGYGLLGRPL